MDTELEVNVFPYSESLEKVIKQQTLKSNCENDDQISNKAGIQNKDHSLLSSDTELLPVEEKTHASTTVCSTSDSITVTESQHIGKVKEVESKNNCPCPSISNDAQMQITPEDDLQKLEEVCAAASSNVIQNIDNHGPHENVENNLVDDTKISKALSQSSSLTDISSQADVERLVICEWEETIEDSDSRTTTDSRTETNSEAGDDKTDDKEITAEISCNVSPVPCSKAANDVNEQMVDTNCNKFPTLDSENNGKCASENLDCMTNAVTDYPDAEKESERQIEMMDCVSDTNLQITQVVGSFIEHNQVPELDSGYDPQQQQSDATCTSHALRKQRESSSTSDGKIEDKRGNDDIFMYKKIHTVRSPVVMDLDDYDDAGVNEEPMVAIKQEKEDQGYNKAIQKQVDSDTNTAINVVAQSLHKKVICGETSNTVQMKCVPTGSQSKKDKNNVTLLKPAYKSPANIHVVHRAVNPRSTTVTSRPYLPSNLQVGTRPEVPGVFNAVLSSGPQLRFVLGNNAILGSTVPVAFTVANQTIPTPNLGLVMPPHGSLLRQKPGNLVSIVPQTGIRIIHSAGDSFQIPATSITQTPQQKTVLHRRNETSPGRIQILQHPLLKSFNTDFPTKGSVRHSLSTSARFPRQIIPLASSTATVHTTAQTQNVNVPTQLADILTPSMLNKKIIPSLSHIGALPDILKEENELPAYKSADYPGHLCFEPCKILRYHCRGCSDEFVNEQSMLEHLMRQSLYLQMVCSSCPINKKTIQFNNKCALRAHLMTHLEYAAKGIFPHYLASVQQIKTDLKTLLIRALQPGSLKCYDVYKRKLAEMMPKDTAEVASKKSKKLKEINQPCTSPPSLVVHKTKENIEMSESIMAVSFETLSSGVQEKITKSIEKWCRGDNHDKCVSCKKNFSNMKQHFHGLDDVGSNDENIKKTKIPNLTCNVCQQSLLTACAHRAHLRIHKSESPFQCPECGKHDFKNSDILLQHAKNDCCHYNHKIIYSCGNCDTPFFSPPQLNSHYCSQHTHAFYKCLQCPMAFKTNAAFSGHNYQTHGGQSKHRVICKCPLCDTVFNSVGRLGNHLDSHASKYCNVKTVFLCDTCQEEFQNAEELKLHQKTKHDIIVVYLCSICGSPTGKNPLKHYTQHHWRQFLEGRGEKDSELDIGKSKMHKDNIVTIGDSDEEAGNKTKITTSTENKEVCETILYECPKCLWAVDTEQQLERHMAKHKFLLSKKLKRDEKAVKESQINVKNKMGNTHMENHDKDSVIVTAPPSLTSSESKKLKYETEGIPKPTSKVLKEEGDKVEVIELKSDVYNNILRMKAEDRRSLKIVIPVKKLKFSPNSQRMVTLKIKEEPFSKQVPIPDPLPEVCCTDCDLFFFTEEDLHIHQKAIHDMNAHHPCPLCALAFNSSVLLKKHLRINHEGHTKQLPFVCYICEEQGLVKGYPKKNMFERHMHTHKMRGAQIDYTRATRIQTFAEKEHSIDSHNGSEGGFGTPETSNDSHSTDNTKPSHSTDNTKPVLKRPAPSGESSAPKRLRVEGEEYFVCAKCNHKCTDRQKFTDHIALHHRARDSLQCLECGLSFAVRPALKRHLFMVHRIRNFDKYTAETGVNLEIPPEPTHDPVAALAKVKEKKKERKQTGKPNEVVGGTNGDKSGTLTTAKKVMECTVCYKTFQDNSVMRTHMRSHGMAFIQSKRKLSLDAI